MHTKTVAAEIAREALILKSLPQDLAEELLLCASSRAYARGETVFLQGDPAEQVFIVLEGWVKLFRLTPNGTEAVVGVFTQGRSFAEAAVFSGVPYPVAAEAVTDCQLLAIPARTILARMRARPELCLSVLASSFMHLHGLVSQIEQLKAHTGAQRLAEFLVDLCPVEEGACTITLPYDKSLIAGRLGMKPESLSRAFARLREHGVTVTQNHAAIHEVGRLRDYVDEDRAIAWSKAQ